MSQLAIAMLSLMTVASQNLKTYIANSAPVSTGTAGFTNISIIYLYHPASITERYEINDITCTLAGGLASTQGILVFAVNKITGVNATPGGVKVTPLLFDASDVASQATVVAAATGAPIRSATDYYQFVVGNTGVGSFTINTSTGLDGKNLTLRAGVAGGFEVRAALIGPLTTAGTMGCNIRWTESP